MTAKQLAFIDMAKEYAKEGKILIRESKKQLDRFFAIMNNDDEKPNCYVGVNQWHGYFLKH